MKRLSIYLILFLSFCGLADSAYITKSEVSSTPLICNINGLSGCNVVANSAYSHIFGISLAEYGLLFYGTLFLLAALELLVKDRVVRRALQWIAGFGFVMSLLFVILQIAVIGAICIYCMASAIVTLLIALFAWFIEPVRPQSKSTGFIYTEHIEHKTISMPPSA